MGVSAQTSLTMKEFTSALLTSLIFVCGSMAVASPVISEFLASNAKSIPDEDGDFSDWIEITNLGPSAISLEGWILTDDEEFSLAEAGSFWQFPARSLAAGERMVVFASSKDRRPDASGELHTNFSLSAGGEYLALVSPGGVTIASEFAPEYPAQRPDVSYGLNLPFVTPANLFFSEPTPGEPNGEGFEGFIRDTNFSVNRGFYEAPFEVEISSSSEGALISYTTDGSTPSPDNGTVGPSPATVTIETTTPLRAVAFRPGFQASDVDTQTYLFIDDILQQSNDPEGYPSQLKGDNGVGFLPADYEMDPEVVNDPLMGQQLRNALLSIPTVSIVTDIDHLWALGDGIYQNPQRSGPAWERPASVEFIRPDGEVEDIQVNAGLRIQGGHTRIPSRNPKHSFRLSFKREFGPAELNYNLFPGDSGATQSFDQLILRGSGNQSWLHHNNFLGDNRGRAQYLRDQWAKDSQILMSGYGTRNLYAHLYINGLYWGLYNPTERASAGYGEAYFGGDKDEYYALNSGEEIDGGAEAEADFANLLALAREDLSSAVNYQAVAAEIDVSDFSDYMILNHFGGNLDWDFHNYYVIKRRGNKWRYIAWDNEFFFINPGDNVLDPARPSNLNPRNSPSTIWRALLQNEEYRLLFADRVLLHLGPGGLLTEAEVVERWDARRDQVFEALMGETARWGDYRRDVDPSGAPRPIPLYDREEEWLLERNRLFTTLFPSRTGTVLAQYEDEGLLPGTSQPAFSLSEGKVGPNAALEIGSADGGQIFYTLDGTDPRLAIETSSLNLLDEASELRAFVPVDDRLGSSWRGGSEPFDDSVVAGWFVGTGAGFDRRNANFTGLFDIDLLEVMRGTSPSCFARMEFVIPDVETLEGIRGLSLGVRYDDGFIAYLNGVQIAADNEKAPPFVWDSTGFTHDNEESIVYQDFSIGEVGIQNLRVGINVLALHGMNSTISNSDFLIDAILEAQTETEATVSPRAFEYTGSFPITGATRVSARVLRDGEWSALMSGSFFVEEAASSENLVISEMMYHPADDEAAEFIELSNLSGEAVDLSGVRFSEGVEFTFPIGSVLEAGAQVLVVRDQLVFETLYGADHFVAGSFENETGLSNGGETVTLLAADGTVIQSFTYDDGGEWPSSADGAGYSLVLRGADISSDPNRPESWRLGLGLGGNPGSLDSQSFVGVPDADLDGDGLSALVEYALGTSDSVADDLSEALQLSVVNGQILLELRSNPVADDTILVIEGAETLGDWESMAGGLELMAQSVISGGRYVSLYDTGRRQAKEFYRIRVSLR